MELITLTRESATRYTFTRQSGDLTADLVKSSDSTWTWAVEVCGKPVDSGSANFSVARAGLIACLESVAPAFAD